MNSCSIFSEQFRIIKDGYKKLGFLTNLLLLEYFLTYRWQELSILKLPSLENF